MKDLYSPETRALVEILVSPFPANPKKYAWVSAIEQGPYHIETNDSAANGGNTFRALCGVSGEFNHHLLAAQIFPSQKCSECVKLSQSSTNILDVAPQGEKGSTNGRTQHCDTEEILREGLSPDFHDGNEGILGRTNGAGEGRILLGGGGATSNRLSLPERPASGTGQERFTPLVPAPEPSHFSKSVDHFSKLVAKKLEEYRREDGDPGDENEERDAAEEGALIEASGYPDPADHSRWA